jgi:hypothetical protein
MIDMWDNVKTFYIIIKLNSFKKAADYLLINSSTVSRHIKQLEKVLNALLFDSRNPIVLSTHGKRFFQYIESSCSSLLNISQFQNNNNNINNNQYIFTLYVNDLYFFHLLPKIYNCQFIEQLLSFHNISISENNDFILNLIKQNINNFIYITMDETLIESIKNNSNYIFWSISDLSMYHLFSKNFYKYDTNFILYNGTELWLNKIHDSYIKKNKIDNTYITTSNSIELIFDLLEKCSGHTLLPIIKSIEEKDMNEIKKTFIGLNRLFFICHVNDVFLKLVF